ncbi:MAG: hypothetical protein IT260_22230 [Saprospiraceae bacterium]|nr:hypothetical protein [Saprospiraceae bacterium]
MLDPFRKQLRLLLANGQLATAFERLRKGLTEQSDYAKLLLLRLCQYQSTKKQFIGGLLTEKEYELEQTRITNALLTLLDDIGEKDLNPNTAEAFEAALAGFPLGQMGKLQLVNCDRQEPFRAFTSFFQDHSSQPYQFYFIAGSPTQKPSSFAERIIYEILEDQQLRDDNAVVEYEHEELWQGNTRIERVKCQALPLGLSLESSQLKFKKYFSERMGQYHLPLTLDNFFEARDKCLPFAYMALVFQVEAARWDGELSRYVQWIIEQFRQAQDGQPRFLIFFVVHLPKAQLLQSAGPLPDIADIVSRASDCCLVLEPLNPVPREAISAWFRSVGTVPDERKIDALIDSFSEQLQHQQRWDGRSDFDMVDVEPLLERVYLKSLKK